MYQYKTVVTDYEGMQEALSVYGAQGWKLVSVTPDTWRMVMGRLGEGETLGLGSVNEEMDGGQMRECSASYYLLVFEREGDPEHMVALEAASEPHEFSDYSLPEY